MVVQNDSGDIWAVGGGREVDEGTPTLQCLCQHMPLGWIQTWSFSGLVHTTKLGWSKQTCFDIELHVSTHKFVSCWCKHPFHQNNTTTSLNNTEPKLTYYRQHSTSVDAALPMSNQAVLQQWSHNAHPHSRGHSAHNFELHCPESQILEAHSHALFKNPSVFLKCCSLVAHLCKHPIMPAKYRQSYT